METNQQPSLGPATFRVLWGETAFAFFGLVVLGSVGTFMTWTAIDTCSSRGWTHVKFEVASMHEVPNLRDVLDIAGVGLLGRGEVSEREQRPAPERPRCSARIPSMRRSAGLPRALPRGRGTLRA